MPERLIVMGFNLGRENVDWLRAQFPAFTFKVYERGVMPPEEELRRCEVLFNYGDAEQIPFATSAKMIHTMSAGIDGYIDAVDRYLGEQLPVSNGAGVYAVTLGEHTLGLMLSVARSLDKSARNMPSGQWTQFNVLHEIFGSTVAILGTGDIGTHVAKSVKGMGAGRVVGYKLHPAKAEPPYDQLFTGPEGLKSALRDADFVCVCLPGSPYTKGLLDRERLSWMKQGAILVNIGRGSIVDTGALMEALQQGRLAAAAMDVTDPEPLPADHPLWQMDNVLITAHYAGLWADKRRHAQWFAENLRAYLEGRPLPGAVNRQWKY